MLQATHVVRERGSLSATTKPPVGTTLPTTTQGQNRDKRESEDGFRKIERSGGKKSENGENSKLSKTRNVWNAVLALTPHPARVVDHSLG